MAVSPTLNAKENLKYIQDHQRLFDLSDTECVMVAAINAGYLTGGVDGGGFKERKDILTHRLKGDLQAAIAVELATIPIYLYTYYSINRTNDSGSNLKDPQQYANEAGGVIMSVAVEEMLHMSLSSNIYYALIGAPPVLYENAPASYPAKLPNHNPAVPEGPEEILSDLIPLRAFSFDQLWRYLLIEYAHHPTVGEVPDLEGAITEVSYDPLRAIEHFLPLAGWPTDNNWNSIGQFYSFIRCIIASQYFDDADFQNLPGRQIQPYNYSPNNIDTIYPSGPFNKHTPAPAGAGQKCGETGLPSAAEVAVYANEPDSGTDVDDDELTPESGDPQDELLTISSRLDVMAALETICEQGEGYSKAGQKEELYDDPNSEKELSHFDKFLMLQSQLSEFSFGVETLPEWMKQEIGAQVIEQMAQGTFQKYDVKSLASDGYIANYPVNPNRTEYAGDKNATILNDFCSGLFQYMLLMSETIYMIPEGKFNPKNPSDTANAKIDNQKYFFNVALHRSMIWVLDKLIGAMKGMQVTFSDGKTYDLAPTFDNVGFGLNGNGLGTRAAAFQSLCALGADVYDQFKGNENIISILEKTVPKPGQVNTPSQLPDVSAFWNGEHPTDLSSLYGTKSGASS
ncbi:MAG: ferritin-like domain-containing protein [Pseudomonadota bacterium]